MAEIIIAIIVGLAMIIVDRYIPDKNKTNSFIKRYILRPFKYFIVIALILTMMNKAIPFDKHFVLKMSLLMLFMVFLAAADFSMWLERQSGETIRKLNNELENLRQQITDLKGEMGAMKKKKKKHKK